MRLIDSVFKKFNLELNLGKKNLIINPEEFNLEFLKDNAYIIDTI